MTPKTTWTSGDLNDIDVRVAALESVANGGSIAPPVMFTTSGGMLPSTDSFTTRSLVGIDAANDLMLVAGSSSMFQWTTVGTVTSTDKTQPAAAVANSARKAVKFKGNWYLMALQAGTVAGIWKAAPQSGNTAFTWSLQFTGGTGTGVIGTGFNVVTTDGAAPNGSNDLAMIYVEYSDPTGGPQIWRTTDGTTWTSVLAAQPTIRHFHAVVQDPYNPANVYATAGDGVTKPIWKSTDFGVTWAVIVTDSNWQAVQISFTTNWVWFSADSARGSVFVMDRATNTPRWLPGYHMMLPVASPLDARAGGQRFTDGVFTNGSKTLTSATAGFGTTFDINDVGREVYCPTTLPPNTYITGVGSSTSVQLSNSAQATLSSQTFVIGGDEFYWSAFYGIVDPATGFYYFTANDNSSGGNRSGLFVHTGQQLLLLDVHEASITGFNQVSAEHFIYGGKVWMQGKSHTLISATRAMLTP